MKTTSFERFAGLCAILAGIAGFLYSLAFIVIARSSPNLGELLSALFLMLGGLLSTPAWVSVYVRLKDVDADFALLSLVLGLAGTLGAAIHGSYNLANAINAPGSTTNLPELPSQIDPRGFLTFGAAGLALIVVAWLIGRGGQLPKGLGTLSYVLAALVVILYLGRLIILNAASLVIVIPAVLTGFAINPVWYIWLGLSLRRGRAG